MIQAVPKPAYDGGRIEVGCRAISARALAWLTSADAGQAQSASVMTCGNATIVDDLRSLELSEPGADAAAVYDRAIGLRLLFQDAESGEEHYLIRYPAGVKGRLHRHSAAHTIVVLEGRLEANGRVIGPGAYAHFPGGEVMRHQATPDGPCLFVILFHAPFDVQIVQTELEP